MNVFLRTHSYNINMAHVCYYRSHQGGCLFRMTNGRDIMATCSYEVVQDALDSHSLTRDSWDSRTWFSQNYIIITLDY